MASLSSIRNVSAILLVAAGATWAAGIQVPAGTHIQIRLKNKLNSQTAKAKDPVEAVAIAPVVVNGQFVIPAGAAVRGTVESAAASTKPDERSMLAVSFQEVEADGAKHKIAARVVSVDNARESIDEKGQILGILPGETLSGKLDQGLNKLAGRASGFAEILATVKKAVLNTPECEIAFDAGTDLDIELTAPFEVKGPSGPGPAAQLVAINDENALYGLVNQQPFQTWAENPPNPSDITNLMLAGSRQQIEQVFRDAGWVEAAALSTDSKFETFRAIAEQRGYKEAPVSTLLLEKRPPEMVFEKLTNTFAQRHHLRIWSRPDAFHGKPVWVVAATHDIGLEFSEQNQTFIHKIDSEIDRERAKVVNDLLFTGRVHSLVLVERPAVPKTGQNATGDNLVTDGRMAVLVLK